MLNFSYTFPSAYENSPRNLPSSIINPLTADCTTPNSYEFQLYSNYTTSPQIKSNLLNSNATPLNKKSRVSSRFSSVHRRSDAVSVDLSEMFDHSFDNNSISASSCTSSVFSGHKHSSSYPPLSPTLTPVEPMFDLDVISTHLTPIQLKGSSVDDTFIVAPGKSSRFLSMARVKEEDELDVIDEYLDTRDDSAIQLEKSPNEKTISLLEFLNEDFPGSACDKYDTYY